MKMIDVKVVLIKIKVWHDFSNYRPVLIPITGLGTHSFYRILRTLFL